MQSFLEFHVSEMDHYHINRLHLFRDIFERFYSEAKYFSSLMEGIVIKLKLLL